MALDYESWINDIGNESGLKDQESPIVVNGRARTCDIPDDFETQVGVVGDHRANLITFECARMMDGHDISTCSIAAIKWQNMGANKSGTYIVQQEDRVVIDDTKVRFHWVVEQSCTTAKGTLKFSVMFVDFDENGQLIYCWNSNPNSMLTIGEGIHATPFDDTVAADGGEFLYGGEVKIVAMPDTEES